MSQLSALFRIFVPLAAVTWKATFVFFILATLVSAGYVGQRAGMLATALIGVVGAFLFMKPGEAPRR